MVGVKKIAAILMAFLVLFSTLSFTVEKHFCGNFLVDVSYFGKAEKCAMHTNKKTPTHKKRNCCTNEKQQLTGQDDLPEVNTEKINFKQQLYVVTYVISHQLLLQKKVANRIFFKDIPPPDIIKNYQVLYETFLI